MPSFKSVKNISISREALGQFFIAHAGEILIAGFIALFVAGLYAFWHYAWTTSNYQPTVDVKTQTIPAKSLNDAKTYIEQRQADFNAALPPFDIRNPFE